jgi:hypothetical protein
VGIEDAIDQNDVGNPDEAGLDGGGNRRVRDDPAGA